MCSAAGFHKQWGKLVGLRGNYYSDGGVDAITTSDMVTWNLRVQSRTGDITSPCKSVERK